MSTSAARPCASCSGKGGRVEDASTRRIIRRHWRTCQDCRGTGLR